MTHLIKRINIALLAQLMGGALIVASVIATGANAIDSDVRAQDQVHLEHKIYLEDNSTNDHDDDMTLEEYEASQRAKKIAYANASLAKIKAYANGGAN